MSAVAMLPNVALHPSSQWTRIRNPAAYSHRDTTHIFKHEDALYLSNGYQTGNIQLRDLWKSFDGIDWVLVNASTPYQVWCPVASFGGAIVAVGAEVMRSVDGGLTFETMTADPPFREQSLAGGASWRLIAREDSFMLFGADKVWWTTDLVNWSSASKFYRDTFAVWDFGGYIYMAAGHEMATNSPPEGGYEDQTSYNDVWRVDDPTTGTWERIVEHAPWPARKWPGFCVHGDLMVITGGYDNKSGTTNLNDTWVSPDGYNWREIDGAAYSNRHYPALVSHRGRLLLNNGNQNPNVSPGTVSDVWELR